ncbi:MAG: hypothetical protein Q7T80_03995, partial [Methanoregula sp.]|nr:hypothetical protein [Methanoregula sp.]
MRFTSEDAIAGALPNPFYHQGLVEKLKSKSARKFSIMIRLRVSNQDPVEKLKSKSARKFSIMIRLRVSNQDPVEKLKSK